MNKTIAVLVLLFCSIMVFGESKIVPVFIDQKTEQQIGVFPIDRSYYAKAIDELSKLNAKGRSFKVFL